MPEERKPEGFQPHQMLSDQLLLSGEAMAALNLTNRNVLDKSFIDFFLPAASCFPSISRKMKVVAKCETSKRLQVDRCQLLGGQWLPSDHGGWVTFEGEG